VIRVSRSGLAQVGADAVMRSVGADLQACTAVGQRLGDGAGDAVLESLRALGGLSVAGAVVTSIVTSSLTS